MIYWEILLETENVCDTLKQLYIELHGVRAVASHLGVSTVALRKKLKACDITMLPRGGPHARFTRDSFPEKWWNMSTEQLSRVTGYSHNYVRKLRKEKLCQLEQLIKTRGQDSISSTSLEKSSSEESEKES